MFILFVVLDKISYFCPVPNSIVYEIRYREIKGGKEHSSKQTAVELKCNNMLLITASNHPVESIEGVQIISILNWLKNSEKEICHWKFGSSV